ncbi:MAG: adenylosuccinate synthetase [Acidobacteria bacterium]|nr:adenylosuccinate synthetase [Acidobacteriota bacterium]
MTAHPETNPQSEIRNPKSTIVIGAGFGDEGKGLLTDYHAALEGRDAVVVRFNGGAQAGHTVVRPDGRRHIHSHFGSGTLLGAATFLSRFFVSSPLLFVRESRELGRSGVSAPLVYADDRGLVTTPYDMLINQWAEAARGRFKHGSCGVGFGETIERCLDARFAVTVGELTDVDVLREKLDAIRRRWLPARLEKLNVGRLSGEQTELLDSEILREDFIAAAAEFRARVELARTEFLRTAGGVVFEGAQGLLLDEDYGWFPNVTRSSTGLKNVVELAAEAGLERLECVYATRAYTTRHGAGFLPHELAAKPYPDIFDATNIPNPHQDSLRFAWLDLDLLAETIDADFSRYAHSNGLEITKKLAVTCLDQLGGERPRYVAGGKLVESTVEEFLAAAARAVGVDGLLACSGPTRETVDEVRNFRSSRRKDSIRARRLRFGRRPASAGRSCGVVQSL